MSKILGYVRHPASAVWPDLTDDEFTTLRDNIRDQGQDHPILITEDNCVIDGWHRLRACADLDLPVDRIVCQFSEEEIASKVIGAHAGRRHMTKIDLARLTIATMKACGMEHAQSGDRRDPEQGSQVDSPAPDAITRETVAREANVSESTAMRAIREDKRASGQLPPRDDLRTDLPPHLEGKEAPKPGKVEKLEDQIAIMNGEIKGYLQTISEKDAQLSDRQDLIDYYEDQVRGAEAEETGAEDGGAAESAKTTNRLIAKNRALEASLNECRNGRQDAERENRRLRKRLRALGENIPA